MTTVNYTFYSGAECMLKAGLQRIARETGINMAGGVLGTITYITASHTTSVARQSFFPPAPPTNTGNTKIERPNQPSQLSPSPS